MVNWEIVEILEPVFYEVKTDDGQFTCHHQDHPIKRSTEILFYPNDSVTT